ncbi:hypothetical protein [Bradyrhizobium sp. CCH5-F6]|jgi:hypothetical protein|nr:hypothetical protein [Bradyrhizobium sp. CCH5-F6]
MSIRQPPRIARQAADPARDERILIAPPTAVYLPDMMFISTFFPLI